MTLDALIILAGTFVALQPFLGVPQSWHDVLAFAAGVLVIILGIIVRSRLPKQPVMPHQSQTYAESAPKTDGNDMA